MDRVDWEALRTEARAASKSAYAPYSNFRVGAAALVDGGPRVVRGCNVENAGYGVTLCAECGVVSDLHLGGGGKLTAFVCVDGSGQVIMPCGRCRQLLWENGYPDTLIETPQGVQTLAQVLPQASGPQNFDRSI